LSCAVLTLHIFGRLHPIFVANLYVMHRIFLACTLALASPLCLFAQPQPQPHSQPQPRPTPPCRPARWTVTTASISTVLPGVESNLRSVSTYTLTADLSDLPLHPDSAKSWVLQVDSVELPLLYRRDGLVGTFSTSRNRYGEPAAGPTFEEERYVLHGRDLAGRSEVVVRYSGGCFRLAVGEWTVLPTVAAP
jgi:hypothetical protein